MTVFLVTLSVLFSLLACGLAWRAHRAVTTSQASDEIPADVEGLRREVAALKDTHGSALCRLALVRYDAFGDMGGQMSWSLAALDRSGDGVLLTSIMGRSEARTYAKSVTAGQCEQSLSPEEQRALTQALA